MEYEGLGRCAAQDSADNTLCPLHEGKAVTKAVRRLHFLLCGGGREEQEEV